MQKIYNTLTRKTEVLEPREKGKIKLFVCGPTVYDSPHIGHARTYIAFDMIAKYLKTKGYDVFYLQNITDIDDKIIKRAAEKGITPKELALKFEKEYMDAMEDLKVNSVSKYARATDHIKEIIGQVKKLLEKGYAYQISDGIYYDVSKSIDYGKLSGRTALQAEDSVSRIDESIEKRNKGDFCLWKFSKEGEPSWSFDSQNSLRIKAGRPGWHIEDTAITEKYLGQQYDIHGGARDLIFPHHEAEIAQMEAISGKKPLVNCWLHTGFLAVNGQKMSKSLGNFIAVDEFLSENSARILRLLVLKNHYRSPIDYSEKEIGEEKSQLARIDEFTDKLKNIKKDGKKSGNDFIEQFRKDFETAMEDDLNTPEALAVIFGLINKANILLNGKSLDYNAARNILKFLEEIDGFFGFIFGNDKKEKIPAKVRELADEREKYRREKNWQKADEIRGATGQAGYMIEDTENGPKIKKI
ncbi:MAG: cysteine--tRNA ligase [Patescibacteria group bacterium]